MSMKNWKKLGTGVYAQPLTLDEIQARKPKPKAKAKPPLDPEYANRKILALKAMLRGGKLADPGDLVLVGLVQIARLPRLRAGCRAG